jgi:Spy/CpxP family protein refolding chaperone
MKSKILFIACLSVVTGFSSTVMLAQPASYSPGFQSVSCESASQTAGQWPGPDEVVAKMSSKLNLTEDQKAKITPVIADRQTQMKALMADTSGRRMQKARKAKSIMSDSDKKIEAVLTSDQKKTYAQMKEQMKEEMQARRQQANSSNPQQ